MNRVTTSSQFPLPGESVRRSIGRLDRPPCDAASCRVVVRPAEINAISAESVIRLLVSPTVKAREQFGSDDRRMAD